MEKSLGVRDWVLLLIGSAGVLTRGHFVLIWNAAVYTGCLAFLGFGWKHALGVGAVVFVCVRLRYGADLFLKSGLALLVVTLLVMFGVLPPVENWHLASLLSGLVQGKSFAAVN